MQLLHLPYLAQKEILKQMEYSDLFLLSLVSRRSTKLIQIISWKDIGKILIMYNRYGLTVSSVAQCYSDDEEVKPMFSVLPEETPNERRVKNKTRVRGVHALISSGLEFYDFKPPVIFYNNTNEKKIVMAVSKQFDDLFGEHATYEFLMSRKCDKLPHFLNITRSSFYLFDETTSQLLEDYFMAVPEQEYVELSCFDFNGKLNRSSKFHLAHELRISGSSLLARDALLNFKGKTAFLAGAACTDEDVLTFLNHWKSIVNGNKLEKMEVGICLPGLKDIDRIKKMTGIKRIPASIPPVFIHSTGYKTPCSFYIVREDGIVGWIYFLTCTLKLCVQNFTEQQMLEKYNVAN